MYHKVDNSEIKNIKKMKFLILFVSFCFITQIDAQPNENFYKGNKGRKIKQQGQKIDLETCESDSYVTLHINSSREVESESKKYKGSCSSGNDVQLSDNGVLKTRLSQFADTLVFTKYQDNGRLSFQKTLVKPDISRFQQKIIPYEKGGFIASYVSYPKEGSTLSSVGYIVFDSSGTEITRKTVDELVDASPFAILINGAIDTDFYILQGTNTACGKYKLHKISRTIKVWTTALNYDLSCDNFQLQSFAINNQKDRLGLLFIGTSTVPFSKYFMVNDNNGSLIPTNFDISPRVRYNTRTAFGRNNDVYFARVIDYNSIASPVPDRSAMEILRFDINQDLQSRKRYFDAQKRETDTIPEIEDMLVTNDGNIYVSGSRLKRTWLFNDKESALGATNVQQQSTISSTYIRQVLQEANNPNIIIEVESAAFKELKLDFINSTGQIVRTERSTVQKGISNITMDFSRQAKGLYIIQMSNVEGRPSYKFTKL